MILLQLQGGLRDQTQTPHRWFIDCRAVPTLHLFKLDQLSYKLSQLIHFLEKNVRTDWLLAEVYSSILFSGKDTQVILFLRGESSQLCKVKLRLSFRSNIAPAGHLENSTVS